ncbi:MAG: hypothetical protein E4H20_08250 [Spirochaetales bacterium]|nr:MAG: hypothetical protein E4H20_08250 [Spirochaetales bacterium]
MVRSIRATFVRLSWAAALFSVFALFSYIFADWHGFSDPALFVALRGASYASSLAIVAVMAAIFADIAAPGLHDRFSVKTLGSSAAIGALALIVLIVTSLVRAAVGGMSF